VKQKAVARDKMCIILAVFARLQASDRAVEVNLLIVYLARRRVTGNLVY
jgi:hypothetical protein